MKKHSQVFILFLWIVLIFPIFVNCENLDLDKMRMVMRYQMRKMDKNVRTDIKKRESGEVDFYVDFKGHHDMNKVAAIMVYSAEVVYELASTYDLKGKEMKGYLYYSQGGEKHLRVGVIYCSFVAGENTPGEQAEVLGEHLEAVK